MRLYLASRSPRRRELLHQIGIDPTDPFPEGFVLTDTWGEALDLLSSPKSR